MESLLEQVVKVLPKLTGEGRWEGAEEGEESRFGLGHSKSPTFQRPSQMDTNAVM